MTKNEEARPELGWYFLLSGGFGDVSKKLKNAKIKAYGVCFTGLGAFRGGLEEGVWCFGGVRFRIFDHDSRLTW